jgi:hypothetical protein
MKTLLVSLFSLITLQSFSQNTDVFNNEWYEKLNSDLEYISYINPNSNNINVRIYRATSPNHIVVLKDVVGNMIFIYNIEKECELPIHNISSGIYFLTVYNQNKELTQMVKIK